MGTQARQRLGAVPLAEGETAFAVWAPAAERVDVRSGDVDHPLGPAADGFWAGTAPVPAGADYTFVLDASRAWPDPCSRWQPHGVHGPSRVLAPAPVERGPALALDELVLYELHVGTFTPAGTLDAARHRLRTLRELGVTAVELMPVSTFPGRRGWGYDGLYTSAPHEAYGGPAALRRFVDAAHAEGLGVVLDVVYNHVGPGNEALTAFGPWFTDRFGSTPWGDALDYRQRGVREWALQNAELWVAQFGIDGLRLDAVHAVRDDSPEHVLAELARRVRDVVPDALVISEMGHDDVTPLEEWAHDAMWLDFLHHELHVALTGERDGYYASHDGSMSAIARELERPEGARLVVCAQNHDQVGNRALGDRLPLEKLRLAQAVVLFSPYTPLLFQGEEHADPAPFQFFTDHVDAFIAEATRAGRQREFARFAGFAGEVPDPQAEETFLRSQVDPARGDREHRAFVDGLLRLRAELPRELAVEADDAARTLVLRRGRAVLRLDFARLTVELEP